MIEFTTTNEDDKVEKIIENNQAQEDDSNREVGRKISDLTLKVMQMLKELLPFLDANLSFANAIYAARAMDANQWGLIRERHKGANIAVSSVDFEHGEINDPNMVHLEDCEKRLCDSACWSILDLRDVIIDGLTEDEKKIATKKMTELVNLLIKAGYTEVNRVWNIPALPIKKR